MPLIASPGKNFYHNSNYLTLIQSNGAPPAQPKTKRGHRSSSAIMRIEVGAPTFALRRHGRARFFSNRYHGSKASLAPSFVCQRKRRFSSMIRSSPASSSSRFPSEFSAARAIDADLSKIRMLLDNSHRNAVKMEFCSAAKIREMNSPESI